MATADVRELVDHLFRRQSAAMVASLTRILGPQNLDTAEDLVQEALLKALRQWPFGGIPDRPEAWLARVARNLALDRMRKVKLMANKKELLRSNLKPTSASVLGSEMQDDQLRMIFLCCHESIPGYARVALTLKTLGGFSVDEIARAFLTSPATIAQRLVRAKRKLIDDEAQFVLPGAALLSRRLTSVQEVIYLLFNEGYSAHRGDRLIREDLVQEAIRLGNLLLDQPVTATPGTQALLALIHFQGARLSARLDDDGQLLLMSEQDRGLWDSSMIRQGFKHLDAAMHGDELTSFHLEAGIASCHVVAKSFEDTNWQTILTHYDSLYSLKKSPVVALNRIVALAMLKGWKEGLIALDELVSENDIEDYYLFPTTRGELLRLAGHETQAVPHFRRALDLAGTAPEKDFIQRRLAMIGAHSE